jgi:pilus assembly protein CpaE
MSSQGGNEVITVLLVDDIPETRENIKKLLAFEPDFEVVGDVGTGREAVVKAKALKPNIIIMDINMPDMDGITATSEIAKAVPTTAVIMMSVQDDPDYLRKAMLAGARNFLSKPIDTDQLYDTIRTVHARNRPLAEQYQLLQEGAPLAGLQQGRARGGGTTARAGHVLVCYSPQGGAGTTTIATNLAAGLMRKGIRVLLIDADTQYGDVGVFLKLQSQSTLVNIVSQVDDLDTEFFDSIVATHESGLKVLLGPPRPEFADEVESRPNAVAQIIEKVSDNYDFIVVDTSCHLSEMLLALMDIATKIILISPPTLAGIKNVRFVLELFDQLNYPQKKVFFTLNRTEEEKARQRVTIPTDVIEKHLKRTVNISIPNDERTVLSAVNKGVPVIASQRERNRSPIKDLLDMADMLYAELMEGEPEEESLHEQQGQKRKGIGLRLGKA